MRAMSLSDVMAATTASKATIYRLVQADKFPKPRKLAGMRRSVWIEAEVQDWLRQAVGMSVTEGQRHDR